MFLSGSGPRFILASCKDLSQLSSLKKFVVLRRNFFGSMRSEVHQPFTLKN
jgi:hypothetical protein